CPVPPRRARASAGSSWRLAAARRVSAPISAWCPLRGVPGRACAGAASTAWSASTCGLSRGERVPSSSMRKAQPSAWRAPAPRRRPLVIPMATIERIAPRLLTDGRIRRGYLGLGLQTLRLDEALAQAHALPSRRGIMVVSLDPNGPARAAGVHVGDIIISLDRAAVPGGRRLYARLTPESVGRSAELRMVGQGQIGTAKSRSAQARTRERAREGGRALAPTGGRRCRGRRPGAGRTHARVGARQSDTAPGRG